MKFRAWFECIEGCPGKYDLGTVIYKCPKCGSLLEVKHDMSILRRRKPETWIRLFDERFRRTDWPYGSGVWGKKEMVNPCIDNDNVVSLFEGGTNLFWADRLGKELGTESLWIKQCGNDHTGSFKDLGMTVLVSQVKQMISDGKKIPAVACASTGDTSAALAAYCAAAGIKSIVLLPKDKVSNAQLIQPIANNALTLALETDFDGCMKIVQELTEKENIYLANSMNSLRIEGQKTISIEITEQFDWEVPDVIVIPGGNLGNVSALGKGFTEMKEMGLIDEMPQIVCAQVEHANPLYLSYKKGFKDFKAVKAKKTLASAIQIGNPVSINKAIRVLKKFNGIVEQVTENELANATARADRTGLFCCPHTGVALGALFKLIKGKKIDPKSKIVVISTAHGLKFTDFKLKYHESRLSEVNSKYANLPV
ncbi:MAG TPA: threonine synthase, partial [bacterium]|nr:threonine synthase [bacterium]